MRRYKPVPTMLPFTEKNRFAQMSTNMFDARDVQSLPPQNNLSSRGAASAVSFCSQRITPVLQPNYKNTEESKCFFSIAALREKQNTPDENKCSMCDTFSLSLHRET